MQRKNRIEERLRNQFMPKTLIVEDFSHQHSKGAESHFDVYIISDSFTGKSIVARHRMIYAALQEELHAGLHALKIQAFGPQDTAIDKFPAPRCAGGGE